MPSTVLRLISNSKMRWDVVISSLAKPLSVGVVQVRRPGCLTEFIMNLYRDNPWLMLVG